ncbi:hypothetical protein B4N89_17410 [Embleya scabrispora]|uniref:Uncharacterized protein n=1 Tax=Embleya scabrispora TaxID=159449 RepID=A0A1T3P042_9ACTN|nr:hypothetical protein [Embleya scabrispora]OPC82478.1 hypothetical protein B4N89_17410 [Embleya scabrispora]
MPCAPNTVKKPSGRIAGSVLVDVGPLRGFPDFRRLWFGRIRPARRAIADSDFRCCDGRDPKP